MEESTDEFWGRQIEASYSSGLKAGRQQAWAEAILAIKSAAAAAYISGGDTREAKQLRDLCLQFLEASR